MPQIRIESQQAKIAMSSKNPVQTITQSKADQSIEQPKAEMTIHHTPAKLSIDQSQAWAQMGLKTVFQLNRDFVQETKQDALQAVAELAMQGDELMKVEAGGNPLANQAEQNSQLPVYEFTIGWIPSPESVNINIDPGRLTIDWNTYSPIINTRANKTTIDHTKGDVNIQLAQYNQLNIDFANLKFVGVNYEQLI